MTTVLDDLERVAARARHLVRRGGRVLGITGPPGVGKSWLVEQVTARTTDLAVAHVPMDGFHLADVALDRLGLRDVKGAPETFDVGGYAAALSRVAARQEPVVYVPSFERRLEQPLAGAIAVSRDADLVLTEGNYLLLDEAGWREVHALLDECWYVEVPHELRVRRLLARHVAYGKSPAEAQAWTERSDEANARLVEATRGRADLVVSLG
ncbi:MULTISPECIES: nucleoside/nucleotide kinase family protein [Mumia]|uniref:Nucleoside/nucleotide kinase family protein n=1 Tax=Mumia xiangluensis TaxID=1678900 RepID=A0ABW1QM40_9ACTN|nr:MULTISPECIES: nucleoside/nucleotide kinase family protein [Mumia]